MALEWPQDPRALPKLPYGKKRVNFMDNASGHARTEDVWKALDNTNADIRFLSKNVMESCLPRKTICNSKDQSCMED